MTDMKYDGGKVMAGTLYEYFPNALRAVAQASTFGAEKYARGSFSSVSNGKSRYTDAMHRHLLDEAGGEFFDPESTLPHAAHAAWGALCRLEFILKEMKCEQGREKETEKIEETKTEPDSSFINSNLFRPADYSHLENYIPAEIKQTQETTTTEGNK